MLYSQWLQTVQHLIVYVFTVLHLKHLETSPMVLV